MTAREAEQAGNAEVVIGIIPPLTDSARLLDGISRIARAPLEIRAALIHPPIGTSAPGFHESKWTLIEEPRLAQERSLLAQSIGHSFRVVFEIAQKLGVRACAIITSDLSTVTSEWVTHLINPVMNEGMDLVTPCYASGPFDGLINRAIVYPLVRALYGRRVNNPMGPDLGISQRLLTRMAGGIRPRLHPLVSLVAESIATDMKICQVYLGNRVDTALDWTNVGPYVSQVLAALFLDVERFAPWWQRARGSEPVEEFGSAQTAPAAEPPFHPEVLIQRFQIGERGLIEAWGTVLPPSTLVELRKLAQQNGTSFRLGDETWARIVYDFALAHRLRPNNREQILRAFVPIYLGWAASYALQVGDASANAERRIEELCVAFETTKPYFVSRWRWPDRFNP